MEEPLVQLALVAVVGLGAQLLAWHLRLPSILLLLLSGFLLGPVFGLIAPGTLLGEALFPLVALSVGIILFEGGLTLKVKELSASGPVVSRLISVGALITWVVAALGARYLLGFDWPLAILSGAILIVTGPTVVGPLLRQIRPKGRAGTILKWEGILIDPVGAVLAVLVFEIIVLGGGVSVPGFVLLGVVRTLVVGIALGLLGAAVLIGLMRRHLIPDYLQSGVTLMLVVGFFTLGDLLAAEGGLGDEPGKGEHHDHGDHDDQKLAPADLYGEIGCRPHLEAAFDDRRNGFDPRTLGQLYGVLQENRHADGRNQRRQPRRAAQRAVGDALHGPAIGRGEKDRHDEHESQRQRNRADVGCREQRERGDGDEGADHENVAVGEIDHADDAVHHRVADRDQSVH